MSDKKYILELTFEEAETLRIVCCHIGGHKKISRRKYIDNIKTKLEDVGVYLNQSGNFFEGGYMASLYFLEEPQKKKMTIEQIEEDLGYKVEVI